MSLPDIFANVYCHPSRLLRIQICQRNQRGAEIQKKMNEEEIKKKKTSTMELNKNELETAAGGGIPEFFQAMKMAWDIHSCENNNHDYEWQGELENEVHFNFPYYWQNKILVCTKCGKKKVTNVYKIVGDIRG